MELAMETIRQNLEEEEEDKEEEEMQGVRQPELTSLKNSCV